MCMQLFGTRLLVASFLRSVRLSTIKISSCSAAHVVYKFHIYGKPRWGICMLDKVRQGAVR